MAGEKKVEKPKEPDTLEYLSKYAKAEALATYYFSEKDYDKASDQLRKALTKREEIIEKYDHDRLPWKHLDNKQIELEIPTQDIWEIKEFQTLARKFLKKVYPDRKFIFDPKEPYKAIEIEKGRKKEVETKDIISKSTIPPNIEEKERKQLEELRERLLKIFVAKPKTVKYKVNFSTKPEKILGSTPFVFHRWKKIPDIAYYNMVAEVGEEIEGTRYGLAPKPIEFKETKQIGEITLRWCIDDKGKPNIGVEMFHENPFTKPQHTIETVHKGINIREELVAYLKSLGYLDYKECITPYTFEEPTYVWEEPTETGIRDDKGRIHYLYPITDRAYWMYRIKYAGSRETPCLTFDEAQIATEMDEGVREALADNYCILRYEDIREKLFEDESPAVRVALLENEARHDQITCERLGKIKEMDDAILADVALRYVMNLPRACACEFIEWALEKHTSKISQEAKIKILNHLDDLYYLKGCSEEQIEKFATLASM